MVQKTVTRKPMPFANTVIALLHQSCNAETTIHSIASAFSHCILPVCLKKDLPRSSKPRSEPLACINVILAHVPEHGKGFVASWASPYAHCGHPNTRVTAARGIVRVHLSG